MNIYLHLKHTCYQRKYKKCSSFLDFRTSTQVLIFHSVYLEHLNLQITVVKSSIVKSSSEFYCLIWQAVTGFSVKMVFLKQSNL